MQNKRALKFFTIISDFPLACWLLVEFSVANVGNFHKSLLAN